jgi:hypothetical protein
MTALPQNRKVNANISEKPGSRLTERQNGHISDATSRLSCISSSIRTEVSGLNGLDDPAAFVAGDVREIAAHERQQKSAALWIAKI